MKKTKSVVFNNTGKLHDKIFNVNNVPIERAKRYNYLGVYRLIINKINQVQWVDFKLENVHVTPFLKNNGEFRQ
jgi:hypothetical protein